MAISVNEVKKIQKAKEDADLTKEELAYIDVVEKYIDKEILKKTDKSEVWIFLYYANLVTHIETKQSTEFPEYRRLKMHKELITRYKTAGWKIDYHYDDGLDGPNRSGSDYLILKKHK